MLFNLRKDAWGDNRGGEDDGSLGGGHEVVDSGHKAFIKLIKHNVNLQEEKKKLLIYL